mgnify:CR=1 FL=1
MHLAVADVGAERAEAGCDLRGPTRGGSSRTPPRRPATMILTPFAPAFIDRWMRLLHRLLEGDAAGQLLADVGARRGTRPSSGWRISLISSLTLRFVSAPICWRRISTFWPPLPITMPGLAVWTVTVTWPKLRSISRPLTLALASRFSTSWRASAMSSVRRAVYSLSCVPLRGPRARHARAGSRTGGPCVPCSSALPVADGDGDVRHGACGSGTPDPGRVDGSA